MEAQRSDIRTKRTADGGELAYLRENGAAGDTSDGGIERPAGGVICS